MSKRGTLKIAQPDRNNRRCTMTSKGGWSNTEWIFQLIRENLRSFTVEHESKLSQRIALSHARNTKEHPTSTSIFASEAYSERYLLIDVRKMTQNGVRQSTPSRGEKEKQKQKQKKHALSDFVCLLAFAKWSAGMSDRT